MIFANHFETAPYFFDHQWLNTITAQYTPG